MLDYRYALYKQTKQSEVAKTYLIGHDPGEEQERHPELWTGRTKKGKGRYDKKDEALFDSQCGIMYSGRRNFDFCGVIEGLVLQ